MIKYFCVHTLWFVFIFTVIKTNTIVLNHKLIAVFCTQAYGAQFVQKVHHRHVLAKNYFSHVPGMMDKMQEKVLDMPLPRPKERVVMVPWKRESQATTRSGSKTVTPPVEAV